MTEGHGVAVFVQGISDCAHPRSEAPTSAEECPMTEGHGVAEFVQEDK